MSHETKIGNLNNRLNDEDSELVDSILKDLNNHSNYNEEPQALHAPQAPQAPQAPPDMNPPKQELTPEQMRQIQMQRQMAMQQQQLMQQQQMAQQMAQQMDQRNNDKLSERKEMKINEDTLLDKIKNQSKKIILVIFLSIIFNLEQVDGLFKTQPSLFISENGSLNIQAIFIKALIIGALFYGISEYLL